MLSPIDHANQQEYRFGTTVGQQRQDKCQQRLTVFSSTTVLLGLDDKQPLENKIKIDSSRIKFNGLPEIWKLQYKRANRFRDLALCQRQQKMKCIF